MAFPGATCRREALRRPARHRYGSRVVGLALSAGSYGRSVTRYVTTSVMQVRASPFGAEATAGIIPGVERCPFATSASLLPASCRLSRCWSRCQSVERF